jgi:hypothetical protein
MRKSNSGLLFGVALALTITATPAAEAPSGANVILPGCRAFVDRNSRDNLMLQGFCVGTVNGIAFATGALREFPPLNDDVRRELCSNGPDTATNDQLVRIVIAYIEARPERMHEPFERLAAEALVAAWPCR